MPEERDERQAAIDAELASYREQTAAFAPLLKGRAAIVAELLDCSPEDALLIVMIQDAAISAVERFMQNLVQMGAIRGGVGPGIVRPR